jgi:predicted AlkP superfamily pyrophosphatase or phosphodiesterase
MILIIVFDGLRTDQVSWKHTPTLVQLAQHGVQFKAHHATFPTETRVNVASLVTGCYPNYHGLVANEFYQFSSGEPQKINTGTYQDLLTLRAQGDHILHTKCLSELIGPTRRIVSINIGTSGNAYLNNHMALENNDILIHPEFSLPSSIGAMIERQFGPWPPARTPNTARIEYATQVLLEYVIPVLQPTITTLWLSEPDSTQHKTQINSLPAQHSIQVSDQAVQQILDALAKKALLASTDVLLMSDHGQATVSTTVDVATELIDAGLKHSHESTDILVAGKGGSISLYIANHRPDTVNAIIEFLLPRDWCGPLFTSAQYQSAETFPLSQIHCQHARSPSLLMAFNWHNTCNNYDAPGSGAFAEAGVAIGRGSHGSLSPYEIRNVLIAAGPHFKQDTISTIPSGNIDLLPTLLAILDLPSTPAVVGRVLTESLRQHHAPSEAAIQTQIHHRTRDQNGIQIVQKLQEIQVESTSYIDCGWVTRS